MGIAAIIIPVSRGNFIIIHLIKWDVTFVVVQCG